MRKINKVKIYKNDNNKANNIYAQLIEILNVYNFEIVDKKPDLAIAIGGDGSFLRMVKSLNYRTDIYYVGINAGTLGFLQEVKLDNIDNFFDMVNRNDYDVQHLGIQETLIKTKKEELKFYSVNEIVIREKELNLIDAEIKIDKSFLERYIGDGLLIATSVGSTAYNLSFGGAIVYDSLHTLQITPIAPLNTKAYRDLMNSLIIPEHLTVEIIPNKEKSNLLVSIDGRNHIFKNVEIIKTKVHKKKIKGLRCKSYSFFEKINDKFLT